MFALLLYNFGVVTNCHNYDLNTSQYLLFPGILGAADRVTGALKFGKKNKIETWNHIIIPSQPSDAMEW